MHFLLTQFMTGRLVNILPLGVCHFSLRLGKIGTRGKGGCWHLWVREGFWCLGRDGRLAAIYVGCPKIPLQILHCPGKLVLGSRPNAEDIIF